MRELFSLEERATGNVNWKGVNADGVQKKKLNIVKMDIVKN